MLALPTTEALALIDPTVSKSAPPSIPFIQQFSSKPTATVWSQDNAALFVAFAESIHEYTPLGSPINQLISSADSITSLIAKDKGQTIIFAASNKVQILEYGSGTGKITQTFTSHKSPINSLSLSNDSTLLASTSGSAVHIHNLTMNSHTVLRGFPQSAGQITTCSFHPHSRTRLLLGMGKQVMIYDTTRPSGPMKVIPMSDTSTGNIVALACSPFSKTLIAVATSGGYVGLVDLEKEKGLFRTINLKMPLTTASFSPEGAALYFGTENGKLLILDLRMLDKQPKCISIGTGGCRVECMSFQKKIKTSVDSKAKLAASTVAKPTNSLPPTTARRPSATKTAPSPARIRAGGAAGPVGSPARSNMRKGSGIVATSITKSPASVRAGAPKNAPKKVFSPVRDPLGNSVGASDISVTVETLGALKKRTVKQETRSPSSITEKEQRPSSRISTTRPTNSRASSSLGVSDGRLRAGSTASRTESVLGSRRTSGHRPASRTESSISRSTSPELPTPCTISAFSKQTSSESRTPSPELPSTAVNPVTPVAKKRVGMGILGLGTPEVEMWIEAGKGKDGEDAPKGNSRRVGFKEASEDSDSSEDGIESADDVRVEETQRNLSMQISPRRAPPSWSQAPIPSPLRTLASGSSPSSSAAHNLLRTIIADVMYDYQRETKAEMTGLHLDLVRMGRGLRRELREVAEGGIGGLAEVERLREENRLLKEDNERLRRGY